MGCHFILQGIFLTQGQNPYLLNWQVDSLPLSHPESPYLVLEGFKKSGELPRWLNGKESIRQCGRHRFYPWFRKIHWRTKRQPTPVILPGKSHGKRNLAGYSPWGCERVGYNLVTKTATTQEVRCRSD